MSRSPAASWSGPVGASSTSPTSGRSRPILCACCSCSTGFHRARASSGPAPSPRILRVDPPLPGVDVPRDRLALRLRITFVTRPTFVYSFDTPGSLSKSRAYCLGGPSAIARMLELELPADVRAALRARLAGDLHSAASIELEDGNYRAAWRWHFKSLTQPSGWRYLALRPEPAPRIAVPRGPPVAARTERRERARAGPRHRRGQPGADRDLGGPGRAADHPRLYGARRGGSHRQRRGVLRGIDVAVLLHRRLSGRARHPQPGPAPPRHLRARPARHGPRGEARAVLEPSQPGGPARRHPGRAADRGVSRPERDPDGGVGLSRRQPRLPILAARAGPGGQGSLRSPSADGELRCGSPLARAVHRAHAPARRGRAHEGSTHATLPRRRRMGSVRADLHRGPLRRTSVLAPARSRRSELGCRHGGGDRRSTPRRLRRHRRRHRRHPGRRRPRRQSSCS